MITINIDRNSLLINYKTHILRMSLFKIDLIKNIELRI